MDSFFLLTFDTGCLELLFVRSLRDFTSQNLKSREHGKKLTDYRTISVSIAIKVIKTLKLGKLAFHTGFVLPICFSVKPHRQVDFE